MTLIPFSRFSLVDACAAHHSRPHGHGPWHAPPCRLQGCCMTAEIRTHGYDHPAVAPPGTPRCCMDPWLRFKSCDRQSPPPPPVPLGRNRLPYEDSWQRRPGWRSMVLQTVSTLGPSIPDTPASALLPINHHGLYSLQQLWPGCLGLRQQHDTNESAPPSRPLLSHTSPSAVSHETIAIKKRHIRVT